jgi:hypothetical protein
MNTGTAAATAANKLNASPLAFRNGPTSFDLCAILGLAGAAPIDNAVRIDDFVYQSGIDLSNPLAGFDPGLTWTPETLTVNGNLALQAGSALELNLSNPGAHDVLEVTGQADLAGTLNVTLAVGASPPQAGDIYDILDFGTTTGAFASLNLPPLSAGLSWDASELLSLGALKVIALPGNFDHDSDADGADFLAWQRGQSPAPLSLADFADWQANFGTALSAAPTSAAVPETAAFQLALLAATLIYSWRRAGRASSSPLSRQYSRKSAAIAP